MKRIFLFVAAGVLCLPVFAQSSGSCGENLQWTMYANGVLEIVGAGEMDDYSENAAPWAGFAGRLTEVQLRGVWSISANAFANQSALHKVTVNVDAGSLPLAEIGDNAFLNCTALDSIIFNFGYSENDIPAINKEAFTGIPAIEGRAWGSMASLDVQIFVPWRLYPKYFLSNYGMLNVRTLNNLEYRQGVMGTCTYEYDEATGVLNILPVPAAGYMSFDLEDYFESPFFGEPMIKEVHVAEGVEAIGTGAFYGCHNLTKVILPSTFVMMSDATDPEVETVYNPFYYCENLKVIESYALYAPDYNNDMMVVPYGTNLKDITLYVDEESVESYLDDEYYFGQMNIQLLPAKMEGEFGYGLTWRLSRGGKLTISGDGLMPMWETPAETPWYEFQDEISVVAIGNGVINIGSYAFNSMTNLNMVLISPSVWTISDYAFDGCNNLENIVCYNLYMPVAAETAFPPKGHDELTVYVMCEKDQFESDNVWGQFTIVQLGAENTTIATESIEATALSYDNIAIIWAAVANAEYYIVTVTSEDNTFSCTIKFDPNGEVISVQNAPRRYDMRAAEEEELQAWKYVLYGLQEGTNYNIQVVAYDESETQIKEMTSSVRTLSQKSTAIETVENDVVSARKVLNNGQLLIIRDGKVYSVSGAQLR